MKIAIVGAGSSGVVLSILLKEMGLDVTLLERKDRILKKLLTTGNGRCNYTNINASYSNYYSIEKKISNKIFNNYSYKDVIKFFENLGISPRVENLGKVYPYSLQASSIVDALRFKLESLNINLKLNFEVAKIKKKSSKFIITSLNLENIEADIVIMSTGGKSYQELGSNGTGFEIAKKMGHSITKLYPILVQLKSDKKYIKGLEGVKQIVNLSVYKNEKLLRSDKNELLFTPYGISGPCVFNLSYLTALNNIEELNFVVDFIPDIDKDHLFNILKFRRKKLNYLEVKYFLNGIVNKKLSQFILKECKIEKMTSKTNILNDELLLEIINKLKNFEIKCFDTTGFSNAQVTAGGVSFNDIDDYNLESKKITNLYFIGEMLDIFGDCGGYNLNWCFISAFRIADLFKEKYVKNNKY